MRTFIAVLAVALTGCGMNFVDFQAQAHGDPGTAAWDCQPEALQWDAESELPPGTKWGGTCTSTWQCSNGVFKSSCTASPQGYWDCGCEAGASEGASYASSGYCDMTEAERAARANVGCGWKIPVSAE